MNKFSFKKINKVSTDLLFDVQNYLTLNSNRPISEIYSELCSKKNKTQAEYYVWAYIKFNRKKLGIK